MNLDEEDVLGQETKELTAAIIDTMSERDPSFERPMLAAVAATVAMVSIVRKIAESDEKKRIIRDEMVSIIDATLFMEGLEDEDLEMVD